MQITLETPKITLHIKKNPSTFSVWGYATGWPRNKVFQRSNLKSLKSIASALSQHLKLVHDTDTVTHSLEVLFNVTDKQ